MFLPDFGPDGHLTPGLHAASFAGVATRFGIGSESRERQIALLRQVVAAAKPYLTLKRILVWGSFVTQKREPNDLDYSVIVSVGHQRASIAPEHRRFFVPHEARQFYGLVGAYLVIPDYPLEQFAGKLDFLCRDREGQARGIIEIALRGEFAEEAS